MSYPIEFMGKRIMVSEGVEQDFVNGEGPIAAKYLHLEEGDVFFDVGAAWAMWTLYGLAQGAYVWSFEPSEHYYQKLIGFISANEGYMERCKLLRVALGYKMPAPPNPLSYGSSITLAEWYKAHGWHGELTPDCFVPTEFRTIDSFLPELDSLNCIKIDVEGGELDVLMGGRRAITEYKPNLIIENHLNVDQIGAWMRENRIYEKMMELLGSMGYSMTEVPHQGGRS